MRRLVFFVFLVAMVFLGGCLSPRTIKPLADQNLTNIQNLVTNNATLYESYGRFVEATGKLEVLNRLRTVSEVLAQFTKLPGGEADTDKIKGEVEKLQPLVDSNKSVMTADDFETFRRTLATEKPVIGDIAAGFLTQDYVEKVIPTNHHIMTNQALSAGAKVQSAEPFLREFYLAKSWQQALEDTLSAVNKFLSIVKEQGDIAKSHAYAFKAFSESNANFMEIAKSLTSNVDVQTSIAELVGMTTKDPNRKAAAEKLLKTVTKP